MIFSIWIIIHDLVKKVFNKLGNPCKITNPISTMIRHTKEQKDYYSFSSVPNFQLKQGLYFQVDALYITTSNILLCENAFALLVEIPNANLYNKYCIIYILLSLQKDKKLLYTTQTLGTVPCHCPTFQT